MSNDLRKRAGGPAAAAANGLPRPGASSSSPGNNNNGYHRQTPPGGGAGFVSPGVGVRPPPPPFQAQQQSSPNMYHQSNPLARTAASSYSAAASPYQAPSRPAYNYSAPAAPSGVGVGLGVGVGGYGGYGAGGSTSTTVSTTGGGTYGGYSGGGSGATAMSNATTTTTNGGNYAFTNNSTANGRASSMDDNKYRKKKGGKAKGRGGAGGDMTSMFLVLGVIFLTIYGIVMTILFVTSRSKTNSMLKQLDQTSIASVVDYAQDLQHRLSTTQRQLTQAKIESSRADTQKIATLQKEIRLLQQQADDLKQKHESPVATKKKERSQNRELAFSEQVRWLQASARRESKRTVLERFGPGPHRVEITYALGYFTRKDALQDTRPRYSFFVELAPLDLVPHAVHLFLEQVEHGLLNGTYFYLNGPHILQAGPQLEEEDEFEYDDVKAFHEHGAKVNKDGDPVHVAAAKSLHVWSSRSADEEAEGDVFAQEDRRMKRYADLGLDKLAFPDYSHGFPHETWTLGYTGRPGGPDWYINKVDNTKGHGPGGQHQHALEEQGDSCFGRVEAGQGRNDLAQHLFGASIYDDRTEWHYFLEEPVEIVGATILTKKPEVIKIDMGTPLHRQEFFHDETFGDLLEEALEVYGMDPVESDPNNVGGDAMSENAEQVAPEGQQEQQIPESAADTTSAAKNMNNVDQNIPPRDRERRKPILPKIEGQAEA